jgi:uncharacterized protein
MEVFGPAWKDYTRRIEENWIKLVSVNDLVLVPGDLSWAMRPEEALLDLDWIDRLPGEKLIVRGNHDYWWPTSKKLTAMLPPTFHFIHNTAFEWDGIAFAGARLWDTEEYSFDPYIEFVENPLQKKRSDEEIAKKKEEDKKIFERELERLRLSLEKMNPRAKLRIALTHYPPIGPDLKPSRASALLEDYRVDICVFGHLHNVKEESLPFGEARGVRYLFASADYLSFTPIEVCK